ncbi:MAG: HAD family hydrolase [Chloroflexi bacterium]|nr:HAD family hydrolase [Chloroflexota bacterium]
MTGKTFTALLLDLDGTIIGPNEGITRSVETAIRRVSEQVPVSIVTGREPYDVLRFSRQLGLARPQVCDGGASVLDPATGEYLWRTPIPLEAAREVLAALNGQSTAFIATHQTGVVTHESHGRGLGEPPDYNRISALDLSREGAEALAGRFKGHRQVSVALAYLPYNTLWAVDFTRTGVNKAAGARKLAELLGTTLEATAMVGDSYNDLPLFESCGVRVAMGNAPEEIRTMADHVAPSVEEDGLAAAIDHYLLPLLTKK